jgi:long-chain-fatty-acid--CoA ligase ACSBG
MDRCTFCYSGAAPISQATLQFFGVLGIHVMEVYGMSECTGPQCMGTPDYFKIGTVGPALPGTDLKIDHVPGRDKPGVRT